MKQHAIPQNILDVEFKIFTKFTLKEFAYLAIGIGSGGVFLYMYAKNQVPGIIALPIFIVTSGIGIFFALIPINDQPADQFIKNFLNAIRKPTRRVWLNSKMKKSRTDTDAEIAKEQAKRSVEEDVKKPKIIGSSKIQTKKETVDDKTMDLLGDDIKTPKTSSAIPTAKPQSIKKTFQEKQLIITSANIKNLQFEINGYEKLPGNINLWISDKEFLPVSDVIVQLYDKDGNMLYANKTQSNGYFLTNRMFKEDVYSIKLSHTSLIFPLIKIALSKDMNKKPIKITAL